MAGNSHLRMRPAVRRSPSSTRRWRSVSLLSAIRLAVTSRSARATAVHPDIEIVGVVKESKHGSVREKKQPFVYLPYAQESHLGRITFYLRTEQELAALAPALRREVQQRDSNLPLFELKTLEGQVDESMFADRFLTTLSICFGLLAAGARRDWGCMA